MSKIGAVLSFGHSLTAANSCDRFGASVTDSEFGPCQGVCISHIICPGKSRFDVGERNMQDRLQTIIHHITTICEPDQLGRTKLAKILWLSDVECYRLTGKTITGADNYIKDEHGPRHVELYDALDHLKRDNKLIEPHGLTPVGVRNEYIPLKPADLSFFTADEIAIVDRVTARIARMTAKQAANLTHTTLWEAAYFNERIPVAAEAPVPGHLTPEIMEWAEGVFNEHSSSS